MLSQLPASKMKNIILKYMSAPEQLIDPSHYIFMLTPAQMHFKHVTLAERV